MRREFRCFYSSLFVSTCLLLFIYHNINAKVEVIQKMNGLYVPFMVNNGQIDERVSLYAKIFGGIVFVTRDEGSSTLYQRSGKRRRALRAGCSKRNSWAAVRQWPRCGQETSELSRTQLLPPGSGLWILVS
jgi:hypothetical protein